jgi:uncharacterized protein (TIGR02246 family)
MTQDEQAIREIVAKLEAAWNAADSKSFVSDFAEDAAFIHIFGHELNGRAAIEAAHQRIFDSIYKNSRVRWTLRGVRFLRPDVAMAWTEARVQFAEGDSRPEVPTRPTMVLSKENGRWQTAFFQNTRISEIPAPAKPPGE